MDTRATHPSTELPLFAEISALIEECRSRAVRAVNQELIDLYWEVGKRISQRVEREGWGKAVVERLAQYLKTNQPNLKGYTRPNLYRMKLFYETYTDYAKFSPLVRQISWSANLIILGKTKSEEERCFYLHLTIQEQWSRRALERQIDAALFERTLLSPPKVSPLAREIHPAAQNTFKDAYVVDFLKLPETHSEADLHNALLSNLRDFLIELGRDFCFIGSEHPIQVGNQDFALDLLFFHRELNALVAIELKIGRFQPEHLGKLNFYLEALDRDIRKPHENPSIGLLLCASKDDEVAEYALSRSLSPTLIAEYQTKLPNKKLLQAKLHEFLELSEMRDEG